MYLYIFSIIGGFTVPLLIVIYHVIRSKHLNVINIVDNFICTIFVSVISIGSNKLKLF